MASNNDFKFPVQMAWVTMETELKRDVRFIFLTLRLPRPFRWFEKFELARNRVLSSPLVSHTKYRNLHIYFIDLLSRHIIPYYSGYYSRFTLKRSWFECQLGIYLFFIFFVVVFCLLFIVFDLVLFFFFFIFNRINSPTSSAFKYKIAEDSRSAAVLHSKIQPLLVNTLIMLTYQSNSDPSTATFK